MKYCILLMIVTFSLIGEEMEERVGALEDQMSDVGTETADGGYGAKLANGKTFNREWIGLELFGGPLLWRAKIGGTEYVYSLATGKEKIASQCFDWDFGYRIGAGIFLPIVKWEVVGTYTHFGTRDLDRKGGIDYDALMIEIRRSSFLSRLFGMGSSIGAKRAMIDQVQRVNKGQKKRKDRSCFKGEGPLIGGNVNWHLFSGISLFGDVRGALLYGHFEVKHREKRGSLKGSVHLFSPNLSFLFGLRKDFPLNAAQISASISYEADYFWRLNRSVQLSRTNRFTAEDVTFYGLTFKFGIEF